MIITLKFAFAFILYIALIVTAITMIPFMISGWATDQLK